MDGWMDGWTDLVIPYKHLLLADEGVKALVGKGKKGKPKGEKNFQ